MVFSQFHKKSAQFDFLNLSAHIMNVHKEKKILGKTNRWNYEKLDQNNIEKASKRCLIIPYQIENNLVLNNKIPFDWWMFRSLQKLENLKQRDN